MNDITLDIETIPSQLESVRAEIHAAAEREIAELSAPKSYTKPETIAEWKSNKKTEILAEAAEKYLKLALDGAFNHIVCIGIQMHGYEPTAFVGTGKDAVADEITILNNLFKCLEERLKAYQKPVFVGHNIVGFDLKIIKQRCVILGIRPPECIPFNTKPWDANPYDTMAQWDAKSFTSLDKICKALGMPGKGDVSGGDVYRLWQEGKIKEIADYCLSDVAKTHSVYKRMTFQTSQEDASWLAA